MREGEICLIPKPGGGSQDPVAYRPLTMIKTDVNILCKVLAKRLDPHMGYLAHEDQCGFIPDRSTSMNIRRQAHVLQETQTAPEEMALVSIDLEKAFDTGLGIPAGGT